MTVSIEEYVDEYHEKLEKNLYTLKEIEQAAAKQNPVLAAAIRPLVDSLVQLENIVDLLEAEATYHRKPFWKKLFRIR